VNPRERLIKLVILLLDSRQPLTFDRIRELLPAYMQEDTAAAKRMFERDKEILRDAGVPIELAPTDVWELEEGYLIPKESYYLPEISFTPEEVSALFVAAGYPDRNPEAERAAIKIASDSAGIPQVPGSKVPPKEGAAGAASAAAVASAIGAGKSIRFEYRAASGTVSARHVDPFALVHRAGRWYAVGRNRDSDEIRSFRLDRVTSAVTEGSEARPAPEGFEAREHVVPGPWGGQTTGEPARIAFSPTVGWWAAEGLEGARRLDSGEDGWTEFQISVRDDPSTISWIASFGPDAVVRSPARLRDSVVSHLRQLHDAL
jgi:proteasome accessory factor B